MRLYLHELALVQATRLDSMRRLAWLNMLLVACAASRRTRTMKLLKAADADQRSGFRWYPERWESAEKS